jgi:hypothetical protein
LIPAQRLMQNHKGVRRGFSADEWHTQLHVQASEESKCRPGNVESRLCEASEQKRWTCKFHWVDRPRSTVENLNADQIFYALSEVEQPAGVQRWRMN